MKPALGNGRYTSNTLNPNPFIFFLTSPFLTLQTFRSQSTISCFSSSMAFSSAPDPSLEKQFGEFRTHLEQSGTLRDRIRTVVSEIESTTRLMYASILLVHHSRPTLGKQFPLVLFR